MLRSLLSIDRNSWRLPEGQFRRVSECEEPGAAIAAALEVCMASRAPPLVVSAAKRPRRLGLRVGGLFAEVESLLRSG